MNTGRKIFTAAAIMIVSIFYCTLLAAQKVKYRVAAVKKSDTSVYSRSNVVEVIPSLSFYVPNSFTPNGDGLNDDFGIVGEGINEYQLVIYNRWGEKIYTSVQPEIKWDGSVNGQKVQDGVYVYDIHLRDLNNRYFSKTGSVTVLK